MYIYVVVSDDVYRNPTNIEVFRDLYSANTYIHNSCPLTNREIFFYYSKTVPYIDHVYLLIYDDDYGGGKDAVWVYNTEEDAVIAGRMRKHIKSDQLCDHMILRRNILQSGQNGMM